MKLIVLICGFLLTGFVQAGIYKCVNSEGKKSYQNSPCQSNSNAAELNLATGGSVAIDEKKQKELLLKQRQAEEQARLEEEKHKLQQLKQQRIAATEAENKKNLEIIKNNPGKFTAFAIPPYTLEDHPPLVDDFIERLPEIQKFRRLAAKKALFSGKCDRVEASELNLKSTKKSLIFLVECSNTQRMYFNESELSDI